MNADRIALLYRYLHENTCKGHTVRAEEILAHYANAGYPYEIKALYRDLHKFDDMDGVAIHYDARSKGNWMEQDDFEPYELRLIVDSIQSSKFITQERARAITSKVMKLTDRHTRTTLDRKAYVAGRIRGMNESVVREADRLHTAIANNRKVSFRYFHYTPTKSRQYSKSGGRYIISPFALQWSDGNFYLHGYDSEAQKLRTFRVDRMEDIRMLPHAREGRKLLDAIDLNAYPSAAFSMFSGEECRVKLRCINRLADVIFDHFGMDTMLIPDGERHFTVTVPIEVSDPFYGWVSGFGRQMKILHPPQVVQGMQDFIKRQPGCMKRMGRCKSISPFRFLILLDAKRCAKMLRPHVNPLLL